MSEGTVGLIVNPSAGRDSRRLVGSAVVSDNYAKRWAAVSVLAGLEGSTSGIEALLMPDRTGLARRISENAPEDLPLRTLDITVRNTRQDTRDAASQLAELADAVVVLGGDGTVRDVALEIGDVPVAAISTGTNNVVPTSIDGTAAGLGVAAVAAGRVDPDAVTYRHHTVRGRIEDRGETDPVMGVAAVGIVDEQFTGTRAILRGSDFVGGVVSRASAMDSGLSGIAGTLATIGPADPGGVGMRLAPPAETGRSVRAIPVPGIVERIGVAEHRLLAEGEPLDFDVVDGVVSVDGERDVEVRDGRVTLWPSGDGPRMVDFEALFRAAGENGVFEG